MSSGSWTVYIDDKNRASKTWNGANNPKAENPYTMTHFYYRGQKSTTYTYGVPSALNTYTSVPTVASKPNFLNEELTAYTKLADAVRNHSFDASVFLGELTQTLELITGNVTKVLTAYRHVRQGNFEGAIRTLGIFRRGSFRKRRIGHKDLSGFWLELQYGWLPLINDVYEAQKALKALRERQKMVIRVQSSTFSEQVVNTLGQKAKLKATVALKAQFFTELSTLQSIGLSSPATVAWELVPWSFVVDWFVPVGGFLSAMSILDGMDYLVTTSKFRVAEFHASNGTVQISPSTMFVGGGYDYADIQFDRSIGKPVVPRPSLKTLEKAFSLGHIKNAAALVSQQIKLSR